MCRANARSKVSACRGRSDVCRCFADDGGPGVQPGGGGCERRGGRREGRGLFEVGMRGSHRPQCRVARRSPAWPVWNLLGGVLASRITHSRLFFLREASKLKPGFRGCDLGGFASLIHHHPGFNRSERGAAVGQCFTPPPPRFGISCCAARGTTLLPGGAELQFPPRGASLLRAAPCSEAGERVVVDAREGLHDHVVGRDLLAKPVCAEPRVVVPRRANVVVERVEHDRLGRRLRDDRPTRTRKYSSHAPVVVPRVTRRNKGRPREDEKNRARDLLDRRRVVRCAIFERQQPRAAVLEWRMRGALLFLMRRVIN